MKDADMFIGNVTTIKQRIKDINLIVDELAKTYSRRSKELSYTNTKKLLDDIARLEARRNKLAKRLRA